MNKLIVGSIVGNEKNNYLKKWLDNVKQYADLHIIIDDASNDGTQQILEEYYNNGNVVLNRNDYSLFKKNEPQLRNKLWQTIRQHAEDGDWIIIVDADEFYFDLADKKQPLMKIKEDVVAIRLLDLWNEKQYRVDGFWSPYFHRMFRFKNEDFGVEGEGLHKSPIPKYACETNNVFMSDLRCHHYSYLRDEDKKTKYDFYMNNVKDVFNLQHAKSIMAKPELSSLANELPTLLITSLIHNRAWVLPHFLKCLDNIDYPKEKIQYCFIINNNTDEGDEMLKAWNSEALILRYDFERTVKGEHKWDAQLIYHMAIMRNKTLQVAKQLNVDYMINIDSDILFPKGVIKHLVSTDKKIISPVFFAGWNSDKKLPQVWDRGGYELSQTTLDFLKNRKGILKVGGLGAFTCIHKSVWESGVHYGRVYNLPSDVFGEDRDFCVRAVVNNFWLFASNYYNLLHIDNREMLKMVIGGDYDRLFEI